MEPAYYLIRFKAGKRADATTIGVLRFPAPVSHDEGVAALARWRLKHSPHKPELDADQAMYLDITTVEDAP